MVRISPVSSFFLRIFKLTLSGLLLGRTSLFLLYFFAGAFVAAVIAIHFGVAVPENPPSATMRGIFVLVAVVAGALAGSVAVLMARWTRYGMGFIAGFAIGWWILSFRDNGLIDVSWGRLVLLLGQSLARALSDLKTS